MNADEITLIRDMRRVLDRLPIDPARIEIYLSRGYVTISGTVKTMRSQPNVILKDEMDFFERRFLKDPRVKGLNMTLRVQEAEKKEREHFDAGHVIAPVEEEPVEE